MRTYGRGVAKSTYQQIRTKSSCLKSILTSANKTAARGYRQLFRFRFWNNSLWSLDRSSTSLYAKKLTRERCIYVCSCTVNSCEIPSSWHELACDQSYDSTKCQEHANNNARNRLPWIACMSVIKDTYPNRLREISRSLFALARNRNIWTQISLLNNFCLFESDRWKAIGLKFHDIFRITEHSVMIHIDLFSWNRRNLISNRQCNSLSCVCT